MSDWRDLIVGDRMIVDDEFSRRVDDSPFTRQEWGLIMTAASFDIENPGDADAAELVADTSDLPAMMPELERVAEMGPMGRPQRNSGGGFLDSLDSLFGRLGLGDDGGDDEERLESAERLVEAYATELQLHLESRGRWEEVRLAAAETREDPSRSPNEE